MNEPSVYCLNPVHHGSSTRYVKLNKLYIMTLISMFDHMLLLANDAKSDMFPKIFSHGHVLEEANMNETTFSSGNDWLT